MFILNLTYKVSIDVIKQYMDGHIEFLDNQFQNGNFILSGRKIPRVGGIIISVQTNKSDLMETIKKDPLCYHKLADYEIIEFCASKTSEILKFLNEKSDNQ
ncbi:hypothetical protein K5X82_16910 [Halosquirtibacter xylanolyticus]|uniref:YciI family protein n=1 Tax=Halosquirtibacter xylanolyticus TaxID=3374599 RepID=UPI003747B30A|nr:hypothetical protein K5X82_16910 [Prolixibacteraceae bacterium]